MTWNHWSPFNWSPQRHCAQAHFAHETTSSCPHRQSLLLQNPREASEDLNDVHGIDSFPFGHEVGVDEVVRIEEGQHNCFFLVAWSLALISPGVPFTSQCLESSLVLYVQNNAANSSQ